MSTTTMQICSVCGGTILVTTTYGSNGMTSTEFVHVGACAPRK